MSAGGQWYGAGADVPAEQSARCAGYAVTEPSGQFVVTDTAGLMWKQCREGQSGATCAGTASDDRSAALAAANASTHAGLATGGCPTSSVAITGESGCYGPAINTTSFPNPVSATDYVWSSSSYAPLRPRLACRFRLRQPRRQLQTSGIAVRLVQADSGGLFLGWRRSLMPRPGT